MSVGNLPVQQIVEAKDYALAQAAKPFLGHPGFVLISVAAMLSTFSAINATLYGSSRLSFIIAKEGELPKMLEKKVWNQPVEGLIITTVLAIALANLGDLSDISTMGSSGFLLIFAAVNTANIKLADQTDSKRWISIIGLLGCLVAFGALLWYTITNNPENLWILGGMIALVFIIEFSYREYRNKPMLVSEEDEQQ